MAKDPVFRIFIESVYMRVCLFFVAFSWMIFSFGCKKETAYPIESTENVEVRIVSALNGNALNREVVLNLDENIQFRIADFKFYISDITFIDENGKEAKAVFKTYPENVFLYEFIDRQKFSVVVPEGKYKSVRFDVGLAPTLNDMNPNQYASAHPMSRNHDMYWDMTKYRFFVLDAVANYPDSTKFNHFISYHLGGDEYLKTVTLPFDYSVSEKQMTRFDIHFDLEKIFESIDITTFFSFHSTDFDKEKGLKMMENVMQSFR